MYEPVPTNLNFVEREKEVLAFWKENKVFETSIDKRKNAPIFTFYDGPPTANGKPHIGHILTRAIKDIIPRYKTMKGYRVLRKAGWDTHGLPVELEVEKQLGMNGKPDIETYGIAPFIEKCKESVWKYEQEWRLMSDRVGFWADMETPYVTYHNNYIESVWWALKTIWDKGLLYKGHKIIPYCPRCGTALSTHEVAQGYKDVKEKSVIVKFKLKDEPNTFFLAWTTTPWTLPSNVGLAVNGEENYAKVEKNGETYILAEALLTTVLGEDYHLLETFKGQTLERMHYEPLFDFAKTDENCHFVACDSYVTLTDGTGIVHIAPAFGEDDAKVGRKYGLPFVQRVNLQGNLTEETPWAGMFVKEADPLIIAHLENNNQLFKSLLFEHNYPFCWRCDTALLYYARDTWFIEMSKLRTQLLKNNSTVNWMPDNIGTGRFGNFLENVLDWGLSRERYWGTPLPIWECQCGHRDAIGSIAELRERSDNTPENIELHKPYIDEVLLNCPKCGGKMKRVSEVIDCWFDSGAMPFAQWHYPFENKEMFEKNFPADFISEAVDQTRGWFYTLMAISTALFDRAPYKNVIVLGHVQDKNGQKMSKHTGNVVDPWTILDKQGADAVRWYFYSSSAPWLPNRFHEDMLVEGQRKFMGTLWNTYAFYVLYANIDQCNPLSFPQKPETLHPMDKWILSKLHSLVQFVDEGLEAYKLIETSRALSDFVDELSNWYVRRSRERFWASGMEQDKINAYQTLYTALLTVAKLSAPYTPFMAESIYQNLVRSVDKTAPESVHFCDFPKADALQIDKELEANMDLAKDIVLLGRAARANAGTKNRQPLANMYVQSAKTLPPSFVEIVTEELNVKVLNFVDDTKQFSSYTFKPQLKTLGKLYGKLLPKISALLQEADGNALMEQLQAGKAVFYIDETEVVLTLEDVLVETTNAKGFSTLQNKDVMVALSTTLTPELVEEGFVREIVSKIQTMRKEANFEVTDKIVLTYSASPTIEDVIARNQAMIQKEVLASKMVNGLSLTCLLEKEWNINGENATFGVALASIE